MKKRILQLEEQLMDARMGMARAQAEPRSKSSLERIFLYHHLLRDLNAQLKKAKAGKGAKQ
jgi:hypothetical protein